VLKTPQSGWARATSSEPSVDPFVDQHKSTYAQTSVVIEEAVNSLKFVLHDGDAGNAAVQCRWKIIQFAELLCETSVSTQTGFNPGNNSRDAMYVGCKVVLLCLFG